MFSSLDILTCIIYNIHIMYVCYSISHEGRHVKVGLPEGVEEALAFLVYLYFGLMIIL